MELFNVHKDILSSLEWKSYSVSRSDKEPLRTFILEALEMRQCRIVHASEADRAPFYVVFDTPTGERHGVLIYAFFANTKQIKSRPPDEHRFQVKYGGNLRGVLEIAIDPHKLITTLFLGIDIAEGIFVAADPQMNTPAPMSRSIEFKREHVEVIQQNSWTAWERDRRPGKSKDRPTAILEDFRTEILVGGRQERLLDLIALERIAGGLDPGERHLIADKLRDIKSDAASDSHSVLRELEISSEALFDLIDTTGRLKMAVRGWVAEKHLFDALKDVKGVSECKRLVADGEPDISLRWKGGAPLLIECKNTLRTTYADGRPKVDFQRTRASKGDPCSRYYRPGDFPILAACLHAVTEKWEFRFALTADLEPHKECHGRITNMIGVAEPIFSESAEKMFDTHYARGGE
jgi:hypothetical protein